MVAYGKGLLERFQCPGGLSKTWSETVNGFNDKYQHFKLGPSASLSPPFTSEKLRLKKGAHTLRHNYTALISVCKYLWKL